MEVGDSATQEAKAEERFASISLGLETIHK